MPRNVGNWVVGIAGKLAFGEYPGGSYLIPVWVWHKFAMPCMIRNPEDYPASNDEVIGDK